MLHRKCITFSATMRKRNQIPSFWYIITVYTVESYFYIKLFFIAFKLAKENAKKMRTLRS